MATINSCLLKVVLLFLVVSKFNSGVEGKSFEEDMTITLKEKRILEKFKNLVLSQINFPNDYMKEDFYLIRWLRARDFNIFDAERMLEAHIKWRKENKMDSIHSEDWSYYKERFPFSIEGRDREGKPLLYVNIGGMDLRKEVVAGRLDRLLRYVYKVLDEGSELVRSLGQEYKNVSQGILILNADGFNLVQHACLRCVSALLSFVVHYETHYPGLADQVFILNTPSAAEPLIQTLRNILHPETKKILRVFGTNKNKWKQALAESIDSSELPPELGGTKAYKNNELDYY